MNSCFEVALIRRPIKDFGIGWHYGVLYLAWGRPNSVVHMTKAGNIEHVSLADFCDGLPIEIEARKPTSADEDFRLHEQQLKHPGYSLTGNNCEDFARYIFEGKRVSYQVIRPLLVAAAIEIGYLAA